MQAFGPEYSDENLCNMKSTPEILHTTEAGLEPPMEGQSNGATYLCISTSF